VLTCLTCFVCQSYASLESGLSFTIFHNTKRSLFQPCAATLVDIPNEFRWLPLAYAHTSVFGCCNFHAIFLSVQHFFHLNNTWQNQYFRIQGCSYYGLRQVKAHSTAYGRWFLEAWHHLGYVKPRTFRHLRRACRPLANRRSRSGIPRKLRKTVCYVEAEISTSFRQLPLVRSGRPRVLADGSGVNAARKPVYPYIIRMTPVSIK
jgi:hypothetical protein